MWKYYVSSVLVSMISEFIVQAYFRIFEVAIYEEIYFYIIPGGLLVGYIGEKLENKYGKGFVLLTIVMSAILTSIIVFFWVYFIR